jgi:hypothetical protein
MSGRAERRLLSLERRVGEDREAHHGTLWAELAQLVSAMGAHAWRFTSATDPRLHLEFLEFGVGNDPRDSPQTGALLARLDEQVAPAAVKEWLGTP